MTALKAQAALRRMPVEDVKARHRYRESTCGAVAMAAFATEGQPGTELLAQCTRAAWPHRDGAVVDGVFGVTLRKLRPLYHSCLGIRYRAALIDGDRFPRTCILHLVSQTHGKAHVVARVNGTLIDTFDTANDEDAYYIHGFFK